MRAIPLLDDGFEDLDYSFIPDLPGAIDEEARRRRERDNATARARRATKRAARLDAKIALRQELNRQEAARQAPHLSKFDALGWDEYYRRKNGIV